jgi:hypothetical protein
MSNGYRTGCGRASHQKTGMRAFDKLPREIRDALNGSAVNFCVCCIANAVRNCRGNKACLTELARELRNAKA